MQLAATDIPSASNLGIALALSTAMFWAISPMFMASVGRRVGSHHTNLLRLLSASILLALVILPVYLLLRGASVAIPSSAQFLWLLSSSLAGMVLGDACFYEGLLRLGPRRAVKLLMLAPPLSLALGWFWLNERISPLALGGAGLVIGGVLYATMINGVTPGEDNTREPGDVTPGGLLFAIGAAIGTALGAVLMRQAFQVPAEPGAELASRGLDAIVAATLRVVIAAIVMWTVALCAGDALRVTAHLKNRPLRLRLIAGTLFGPVGGILCYAGAMKNAPAGLVSTLSAASPLLIIPITAWRYRVRIRPDIILATIVAVVGVAMISMGRV